MRRRWADCIDCGRHMEHHGRGLCCACHQRNRKQGTLLDYERVTRPRQELLDEWELLRGEGYSRGQAAERLGISKDALDKAIMRDRKATA